MKKAILILVTVIMTAGAAFARQPQRGYRGFIDFNGGAGSDSYTYYEDGNRYRFSHTEFYKGMSTSHGFQFNPMYYLGAGFCVEGYGNSAVASVFLDGRLDLKIGKFTPFCDVRGGVNVRFDERLGAYFSPMVGYRFDWGRKIGLNVAVGMTLRGYEEKHYKTVETPDGYMAWEVASKTNCLDSMFSFRVGLDF